MVTAGTARGCETPQGARAAVCHSQRSSWAALGHSQLPTFYCSVPSDILRHPAPNPIGLVEPLNSRYGPQDPPLQLLPKPRAAATPKCVHKLTAPLVSPPVPPCRQEPTTSPAGLGISTPHVPALRGCRLSPIPEEGSPVPSVPSPCSCCGSCPRPCPSFCSAAAHRWRCLR